jgi:hypothetical protein
MTTKGNDKQSTPPCTAFNELHKIFNSTVGGFLWDGFAQWHANIKCSDYGKVGKVKVPCLAGCLYSMHFPLLAGHSPCTSGGEKHLYIGLCSTEPLETSFPLSTRAFWGSLKSFHVSIVCFFSLSVTFHCFPEYSNCSFLTALFHPAKDPQVSSIF